MDLISNPLAEEISFASAALNFVIAAILACVLRWHFVRFSNVVGNREGFSAVFPAIAITTMLVIMIVKSSLALSLGLVGALSIIRFRTPIKEPEELAYLFLAIAIGIGTGANHPVATAVIVISLLIFLALFYAFGKSGLSNHVYLTVQSKDAGDVNLEELNEIVQNYAEFCDLHRLNRDKENLHISYFIAMKKPMSIDNLIEGINDTVPHAEITVLDQKRIPSV